MALTEVHAVTVEAQAAVQSVAEVLGRLSRSLGPSNQVLGAWLQERDALYARQQQLEEQLEACQSAIAETSKPGELVRQARLLELEAQVAQLQATLESVRGRPLPDQQPPTAPQLQQQDPHRAGIQIARSEFDNQHQHLGKRNFAVEDWNRELGAQHAEVGGPRQLLLAPPPHWTADGQHVLGTQAPMGAAGCRRAESQPGSPGASDSDDASLPPSQPLLRIDRVPETMVVWLDDPVFCGDSDAAGATGAEAASPAPTPHSGQHQQHQEQATGAHGVIHGPPGDVGQGPLGDAVATLGPSGLLDNPVTIGVEVGHADAMQDVQGDKTAGPYSLGDDHNAAAEAAWASREQELMQDYTAQLQALWAENRALQEDLRNALTYRRTARELRLSNQELKKQLDEARQLLRAAKAAAAGAAAQAPKSPKAQRPARPVCVSVATSPVSIRELGRQPIAVADGDRALTHPQPGQPGQGVQGATRAQHAAADGRPEAASSIQVAELMQERDKYLSKYAEAKQACREAKQLARHWQSAYYGLLAAQGGEGAAQDAQQRGTRATDHDEARGLLPRPKAVIEDPEVAEGAHGDAGGGGVAPAARCGVGRKPDNPVAQGGRAEGRSARLRAETAPEPGTLGKPFPHHLRTLAGAGLPAPAVTASGCTGRPPSEGMAEPVVKTEPVEAPDEAPLGPDRRYRALDEGRRRGQDHRQRLGLGYADADEACGRAVEDSFIPHRTTDRDGTGAGPGACTRRCLPYPTLQRQPQSDADCDGATGTGHGEAEPSLTAGDPNMKSLGRFAAGGSSGRHGAAQAGAAADQGRHALGHRGGDARASSRKTEPLPEEAGDDENDDVDMTQEPSEGGAGARGADGGDDLEAAPEGPAGASWQQQDGADGGEHRGPPGAVLSRHGWQGAGVSAQDRGAGKALRRRSARDRASVESEAQQGRGTAETVVETAGWNAGVGRSVGAAASGRGPAVASDHEPRAEIEDEAGAGAPAPVSSGQVKRRGGTGSSGGDGADAVSGDHGDPGGGGGGWLNKRSRSCEPWEAEGGAPPDRTGQVVRRNSWNGDSGGSGGGSGSGPGARRSSGGGGGGGGGCGGGSSGGGEADQQAARQVPGRRLVQQQLPFGKRQRPPLPGPGAAAGAEPPRRQRHQLSQPWHMNKGSSQGAAPTQPFPSVHGDGDQVAAAADGQDGKAAAGGSGLLAGPGPSPRYTSEDEDAGVFTAPPPRKRKALGTGHNAPALTASRHDRTARTTPDVQPGGELPPAPAAQPNMAHRMAGQAPPAPRPQHWLPNAASLEAQCGNGKAPPKAARPEGGSRGAGAGPGGAITAAASSGRQDKAGAGAASVGGGEASEGGGRSAVRGVGEPGYKYSTVVRGRTEREGLQAVECAGCRAFYEAVATWGDAVAPSCNHVPDRAAAAAAAGGRGATKGVAARGPVEQPPLAGQAGGLASELRQAGGRHRFKYAPPATPEGFWDIGFGDTQD